ncbi:MAG: type II toxin-antitoxin system VapC family toxin [Promethearchaeota archaeon]|nr:MAG: type II toxin-antitoxin system VapC family toxin [Candidatus Lokiarchaeota archaeon]
MSIKSIVLDTTYILPYFSVNIKELENFREVSSKIWSEGIEGYEFYLPDTCLMESFFKLASEYRNKSDISILNRYMITIPSIKSSNTVKIFNPLINAEASKITAKIRHAGHTDLMDCLIAASATVLKAILLTEDIELGRILKQIPETKNTINWSWNEFIKNI